MAVTETGEFAAVRIGSTATFEQPETRKITRRDMPRIVWSMPLRRSLDAVAGEVNILPRSRGQRVAKRALDLVGSAIGLALLSPLFLVTFALVKTTSRGPALFVQERCGVGGRPFRFYKFRTMVPDAEARKAELAHLNEVIGPAFKVQDDPRVTRVGAFLRKYSLDELPQLWNVVKGDMSLVGPRPPTVDEVEQYSHSQAQRLSVIPGLTGLWQVSGRSDLAEFDRWLALDVEYAQQWSLWLDIKILAKTPAVVLFGRGAH